MSKVRCGDAMSVLIQGDDSVQYLISIAAMYATKWYYSIVYSIYLVQEGATRVV